MPLPISGQVGEQIIGSGVTSQPLRQGATAELIVTELHGKYYENNYRGRIYIASGPAAGAPLPLFSTAAQQFLVWNPPNSGINCVPIKAVLGYVSAAFVPGFLCIGHSLTTQAQPGTITAATIFNGRIGAPSPGKVQVYTPGSPVTALTYHSPLDLSVDTAVAASTNAPWRFAHDFEGQLLAPPGALFSIAANVAQTAVLAVSLIYEELPV